MFIAITMNHMRAVKAWADAHQAQATLDMSSFVLEVKARNRYYRLYPQFLCEDQGRLSHVTAITPHVTGFIGWRPYQPLRLTLSSDKLLFKNALGEAGLATPAHWDSPDAAQADFILKRSMGSFGYQLAGPFHPSQTLPNLSAAMTGPDARGVIYAEAFVPGRNLKVWFWDGQPVHTQCQPYPLIEGDGQQTVRALVTQRLKDAHQDWATYPERDAVLTSLSFQGLTLNTRLPRRQQAWLDYRYGRCFTSKAMTTEAQDNAWRRLPNEVQIQITQAGEWLKLAVKSDVKAPVLCSMDGVLDAAGKVWWLELNSNPICPPTAYFAMMASLFGTPAQTPAGAFATAAKAMPGRAPLQQGTGT